MSFLNKLFGNNKKENSQSQSSIEQPLNNQSTPGAFSFFSYPKHNDYLNIVGSVWEEGIEGALFLPIGHHIEIAEKIVMDLFSCQNSTYRLFASSFVGFIEDPKKQLLLPMYQRERNLFDSLPIDSPERYNSHAIVENLIVSTQIRIVLGVENNKSSNRLGQEWINLLYEIIEDSMNGYQWNSHSWALAILNFTQSSTQRFKDHFVKYEEYYKKNAGKNAIISESLLKDIKGGVTETEMFKSINDNLVMEKVDAAKEIQLEPDVQELIYDLISFMRQNYSA